MLNTLHEVLIFLEDRGRVSLADFKGWKSRQVRGALGRLEREKWIKKEKKNRQIFYELSAQGQRVIDETLSYLRTRERGWDGIWWLVMFDIPESERDLRDKFRRGLMAKHLQNLQGSVWVAARDIRAEVKDLAQEVGVSGDRLNVFSARAENDRNVARAWDLPAINKEYKDFVRRVDRALAKRNGLSSFEIKKLIFDYALIRRRDPNLPSHLLPADWAEEEAYQAYQRLRRELS